jgi:hypothetical protein
VIWLSECQDTRPYTSVLCLSELMVSLLASKTSSLSRNCGTDPPQHMPPHLDDDHQCDASRAPPRKRPTLNLTLSLLPPPQDEENLLSPGTGRPGYGAEGETGGFGWGAGWQLAPAPNKAPAGKKEKKGGAKKKKAAERSPARGEGEGGEPAPAKAEGEGGGEPLRFPATTPGAKGEHPRRSVR